METSAQWNPTTISRTTVATASKSDEFFGKRKGDFIQALVREATQNALDAIVDKLLPGVRMSFRFVEIDGGLFAERYLANLGPHLDEVFPERCKDATKPVRCLVIDDYDTTGLTGGTDSDADADGNFVKFWLRYGESNKGNASGGRHGLGKSTYAYASDLRMFFGVTNRHDDGRTILYGQATLRPHRIGGAGLQYDTYPLFSVRDGEGERNPIEGDACRRFVEDFGLRRERSGLSIVIPFVSAEATPEMIVSGLVTHCFPQICSGSLRVEVEGEELTPDSIKAVAAARPELAKLLPVLELSHAAYAGGVERFAPVADAPVDGPIRADHFPDGQYARMQDLWADGKMVQVEFDVDVAHRRRGTERGRARVVIKRHDDRETVREVFVRGHVTVIDRKPKSPTYVAVLIADDGIVSKFLGDPENPAHDDWSIGRAKSHEYLNAEGTMRRIKQAIRDVHGILSGADEGRRLKDALTDVLFVADAARRPPRPQDLEARPEVTVEAISKPMPVLFSDVGNSIYFSRCRTVPGKVDFSIDLAYQARKKTAKHHRADFDLADKNADISLRGCGSISRRPDGIDVKGADETFQLTIGGFDPARVVMVKVVVDGFEAGEGE